MKKMLSVLLVMAMFVLSLSLSFTVEATSPTYSQNFTSQENMLSSLKAYAEAFPNVEDFMTGDLSDAPEGCRLAEKRVILPSISDDAYEAETFSFGESDYGTGIDYTFASYKRGSVSNAVRFIVYYQYNEVQIFENLNEDYSAIYEDVERGYMDQDYPYVSHHDYAYMDEDRTVYRVMVDDKLVVIYSDEPYSSELVGNIKFEETDILLPVYETEPVLPEVKEGCNRYFFLMPEDWYNEYTDTAGIYWWEGTDHCIDSWPGYKAHKADAENVYYYDVPKDVTSIIWNNYINGTPDSELYFKAFKTKNVSSEFYAYDENELYPNGTYDFNGMIFVIDPEDNGFNEFLFNTYGGNWFYYYGNGEYGTETSETDFEDLPEIPIGCYRYFFLMPDEWRNDYSNFAGIYWWDGSETPDEWPGYKAHKADVENVYYYDVPRNVSAIIWNNFIDGGTDKNDFMYEYAKETRAVSSEYYEAGENENFPEGTGNFNGMICVLDYDSGVWDNDKLSCNWFYYFGNGEYGTDVHKEARALKAMYPNSNYEYMTDIVPYFYPEKFEGKAGLPWNAYDTLYVHSESSDEAPAYVVFEACIGGADQAFITRQFGDFLVTHHEIHSLYELSHFVYVPSEQKVYTLGEAWEKDDLDITDAFTSGAVGRHRGDANLDKSFNVKDATYIQKHIAGFDGFVNTGYLNFDGDNKVTVKDATAIQKAIAGITG